MNSKASYLRLLSSIGFTAIDGGPLKNARFLERLADEYSIWFFFSGRGTNIAHHGSILYHDIIKNKGPFGIPFRLILDTFIFFKRLLLTKSSKGLEINELRDNFFHFKESIMKLVKK